MEGSAAVVVDHEVLARLGSAHSPGEWLAALRGQDLWDLEGLEGRPGVELQEVRGAVTEGLRAEAEAPLARRPRRAPPRTAEKVFGYGGLVVVGGGVWLAATEMDVTFFWAALGLAAALLCVAGLVSLSPTPAPPPVAPLEWPGDAATRALRRFLSRTFIVAAGLRVVENTPHRAYLALRLAEVDRALGAAEGRIAELGAVRARILDANARMDRPGDDPETAHLAAAIATQEGTRERLTAVRELVNARLDALDAQLDRLRVVAERHVLSAKVSRMTEGVGGQDPIERIAADVEVDVAEIEGRIHALALDAVDADARLRAVLEVVRPGC